MALAALWHQHNAASAVFEGVCSGSVCVCAELSEGHDARAAVRMYERRCGKQTVSCER